MDGPSPWTEHEVRRECSLAILARHVHMHTYATFTPCADPCLAQAPDGRPYYYNASTGESVWECPADFVPDIAPADAPDGYAGERASLR